MIYLSHSQHDITYSVGVVSQFMQDLPSIHLEAEYRKLRYLKSAPGKSLLFSYNRHMKIEGFIDFDWARSLDDMRSKSGYCTFEEEIFSLAIVRNRQWLLDPVQKQSIEWCQEFVNSYTKLVILENKPISLYYDNKAAIYIAHNAVQHDRVNHVEIDKRVMSGRKILISGSCRVNPFVKQVRKASF